MRDDRLRFGLRFPGGATTILFTCLGLGGLWPTDPAQAAEAAPHDIAYLVPAGTLDDAVNAFATQARLQILYPPSLATGRRSHGVQGVASVERALAELLRDTDLTAVSVNANTYLLQRSAPSRQSPRKRSASKPGAQRPAPVADPINLASVEVTGTHIPRISLETSTPITVITSEQIESSGYGTLFDLLRLQPGMIGHHPVDVASEGGLSFQPAVAAASASLYSLGPRATLFLVDGQRMVGYGLGSSDLGGLTDLNGIPMSFIERVEILRGGASAIYGADAMAGVVNIILKKDVRGGDATMRYGVSSRGDAPLRRLSASLGMETRGGGDVFIGVDTLSRDALEGDQRDWHTLDQRPAGLGDRRTPLGYIPGSPLQGCIDSGMDDDSPWCQIDDQRYRSLQPRQEADALFAHWRRPLQAGMELQASLRASRIKQRLQSSPMWGQMPLPPSHPDSRDGDELVYAFNDVGPVRNKTRSEMLDASIALTADTGHWTWNIHATHGKNTVTSVIDGSLLLSTLDEILEAPYRYRFDGRFNGPAVLAELSPTITSRGRYVMSSLGASLTGTLFALPAGEARIATGLELRHDRLVSQPDPLMVDAALSLTAEATPRDLNRNHAAVYAELELPLTRNIRADLAWRADHDEGYGVGSSPRLGFTWRIGPHLLLRGSRGEGYRAPSLYEQRQPRVSAANFTYVFAFAPFTPCQDGYFFLCPIELGSMDNPDLRAEESRSTNLGLVWAPTDAFSLGVDHYRVTRRNEYLVADPLAYPELYPQGLIRDENGGLYRINSFLTNGGWSDTRGWEFDARYLLQTAAASRLAFRFAGHYQERLARQMPSDQRQTRYAGYGAPRVTVLGSVKWTAGDWETTLNVRHFGASRAYSAGTHCPDTNLAAGKCRNPSAALLGLNIAYSGFERWTVSFNVNNLTDHRPVNYNEGLGGYSIVNDDPFGRYYVASLSYRF